MAVFSNLPLEIVRCILEFALTPPFGYFRRLLNLRLVNQLFDDEIISSIGRLELLRDESVHCRTVPWHHPNDGAAVSIESGVLFLARYLLSRPHDQSSPWINLSAFLNHLVDSVLDLHAQPRDDPRRPQMLASLCRHLLNRPGHRAPGIGRFGTDVDVSPGGRPWFLEFLFPPSGSLQVQEASKKTLINARVVLGPPWSDGLDGATITSALGPTVLGDIRCLFTSGSTVKAVISSGNVALFRDVIQHLPGDFDVNSFKYAYLETAACSGQLEMVRSVLEPPRGPPHQLYGGSFEYAVAQAIRGRHRDIAWFLLRLRGNRSLPRLGDGLLHYGLREAARTGDADMVAYILETERVGNSSQGLDCCRTPLEIACGAGHEDVVRVLLAAGVDPLGRGKQHRDSGVLPSRSLEKHRVYTTGSMLAAAVGGHVGVADLLTQAGGLELGAEDWRLVVRGAIECGQAAFLDWILAQKQRKKKLLSDDDDDDDDEEGWVSDEFDVLGEACVWGNADILKVLQAHGFLQDRPVWSLGLRPAEVERDGESNLESEVTTFQGRGRESSRYGVQPASLRFETPLLAAMSWSREDVVEFLLSLGWPPIEDVTESSVGSLWREGRFPRRAVRHLLGGDEWTWEASDAPP